MLSGAQLCIALDLEASAYGGHDFRKAFDLTPIPITLRTLRTGGHVSWFASGFRLVGALGQWWRAYGGIIQGDALSTVALNSVLSCIIEVSDCQGV